jgi:hypothetical protein
VKPLFSSVILRTLYAGDPDEEKFMNLKLAGLPEQVGQ